MSKAETAFKSGYASLIGRPNVGKSTLLNRLVAQKIAAMSAKPQTTRNKITGVVHLPGGQIVLVDTPGIHDSNTKLNRVMVKASFSTYNDVDLILFLIDASRGFSADDEYVLQTMQGVNTTKILILNKIDLVPKLELLGLMDKMNKRSLFEEIIPISALKKDGLDSLVSLILKYLPEGPQYFPETMITDCSEEFLIAEIIREKIINQTHFEVPYAVAVVVEQVEETKSGVLVIDATIYTEKDSQKKILIGEKGAMLKKVGSLARKEIEKRFAIKVYLNLFVKVKNRWRDNDRYIREFVYFHD
ncbi:MAG: GTPase Era [Nitrospinae bacterium]|nr:GTPase Era [Nitrospinota bacterium]MCH8313322.1 GTPase Era [Nitrospinota bacterium]